MVRRCDECLVQPDHAPVVAGHLGVVMIVHLEMTMCNRVRVIGICLMDVLGCQCGRKHQVRRKGEDDEEARHLAHSRGHYAAQFSVASINQWVEIGEFLAVR